MFQYAANEEKKPQFSVSLSLSLWLLYATIKVIRVFVSLTLSLSYIRGALLNIFSLLHTCARERRAKMCACV